MNEELDNVARRLVAKGKGLLAADESTGTIGKRFKAVQVESSEKSRRDYRELLFTAPEIENHISGVILFDETIRQQAGGGRPFAQLLADNGIVPGIKVDEGAVPLAGFPGELVTEGLDGLRGRLEEYRSLGARFAKWRAVISIGSGQPSAQAVLANAEALARYAALCQEQGLVPIVEPEVLMDGSHTIERCEEVTETVLRTVFSSLRNNRVEFEGALLKPNMVVPGKQSNQRISSGQVAETTVRCLRRAVPAALPGIVFLSGGQAPEEATARLNAIEELGPHPWEISFSFSRALQDPTLAKWKGRPENVEAAQSVFLHRLRMNSAAREGRYSPAMESA